MSPSGAATADAGRNAVLAGTPRATRQLPECVHCGLCLPACPTYLELGTEMDSPRGRIYLIHALERGELEPRAAVLRHLDLCLGCRACETACPSGVPYGQLLEETRARLWPQSGMRLAQLRTRFALTLFPYPHRLAAALWPARMAQRLGLWPVLQRVLPWARLLPALQKPRPLPAEIPPIGNERYRAGLVTGCVQSVLFAGVAQATARVLSRHGCRVHVPPRQGCCGALHLHSGARERARAMARALIDAFPADLDAILVTAAGCGAAMKEYGELLGSDPAYAGRAARFAAAVRDATEFLAALQLEPPQRAVRARVAYHDACHLAHAQGVRDGPRALLRAIPELDLVEMPEADLCCGSAGTYNLVQPEMARRLLRRKIAHIAATGADCIAVANPGCALQIGMGLRAARLRIRVAHPVELLEEAYGFPEAGSPR